MPRILAAVVAGRVSGLNSSAAANKDLPITISQSTLFDCPNSRNLVFTGV